MARKLPKHQIRDRAKDVLRRADDLIEFHAQQKKPGPERIALTVGQYQSVRDHLGTSRYRGVEFYVVKL